MEYIHLYNYKITFPWVNLIVSPSVRTWIVPWTIMAYIP